MNGTFRIPQTHRAQEIARESLDHGPSDGVSASRNGCDQEKPTGWLAVYRGLYYHHKDDNKDDIYTTII